MQGDVNSGRMGLQNRSDIEMDGGNVVVTYTKPLGAGESFQILGYADREHRDVPPAELGKPIDATTWKGSTPFGSPPGTT